MKETLKVAVVSSYPDVIELLLRDSDQVVICEAIFREGLIYEVKKYSYRVYGLNARKSVIKHLWGSRSCYQQSNGLNYHGNYNQLSVWFAVVNDGITVKDVIRELRTVYLLQFSRYGIPNLEVENSTVK